MVSDLSTDDGLAGGCAALQFIHPDSAHPQCGQFRQRLRRDQRWCRVTTIALDDELIERARVAGCGGLVRSLGWRECILYSSPCASFSVS